MRWAPVVKYERTTALADVGLHQTFRHIGQAQSGERGIDHLRDRIERKLAFDADPQFAGAFFAFFECPGKPAAVQASRSAIVAD